MGVHNLEVYPQIKALLDIPLDEPIFILRAQDEFALETVQHYRSRVHDTTKFDQMDDKFHAWISNVNSIINNFINWRRDNKDKVKRPD